MAVWWSLVAVHAALLTPEAAVRAKRQVAVFSSGQVAFTASPTAGRRQEIWPVRPVQPISKALQQLFYWKTGSFSPIALHPSSIVLTSLRPETVYTFFVQLIAKAQKQGVTPAIIMNMEHRVHAASRTSRHV